VLPLQLLTSVLHADHSFVLPRMLPNQSLILVPPFYTDINVTADTVLTDCDDDHCEAAMTRWARMCVRWITGQLGGTDHLRIVDESLGGTWAQRLANRKRPELDGCAGSVGGLGPRGCCPLEKLPSAH
jgi:hypothetical protein